MITQAESMRLYVTKGDPTQADAGLAAYKDYIAVETDPAKKAKAQVDMAQMLLGAGLAVYATGDKAKYQEAANYLQKFVEVAPDSNPMKASAKEVLTELKN